MCAGSVWLVGWVFLFCFVFRCPYKPETVSFTVVSGGPWTPPLAFMIQFFPRSPSFLGITPPCRSRASNSGLWDGPEENTVFVSSGALMTDGCDWGVVPAASPFPWCFSCRHWPLGLVLENTVSQPRGLRTAGATHAACCWVLRCFPSILVVAVGLHLHFFSGVCVDCQGRIDMSMHAQLTSSPVLT